MLEFLVLQADVGDCLLVKYGSAKAPGYILVDGGAKGTYEEHLGPTLSRLEIERIELGMVSHVDDDHIAGMLKLFQDLQTKRRRLKFGAFWPSASSSARISKSGSSRSLRRSRAAAIARAAT